MASFFEGFTNVFAPHVEKSQSEIMNEEYLRSLDESQAKIAKLQNSSEFGSPLESILDTQVIQNNHLLTNYNSGGVTLDATINEIIANYRKVAQMSYVSDAIDEIVNAAIVQSDIPKNPVSIDFNDPQNKLDDKMRMTITNEFSNILDIMNFDNVGDEWFKQWYIDGRLIMQIVYDMNDKKDGIQKIKPMSPINLRRFFDTKKEKFFYVYDESANATPNQMSNRDTSTDMQQIQDYEYYSNKKYTIIDDDKVVFVPSGLYDYNKRTSISYLHFALRDINRLDTLEDHFLIYRIVRCLHGDSQVWTEYGYKKMKHMAVGDKVYSYNKNNELVLSYVTDFVNNGRQQIWKIKSTHRTIKSNSNHPILVKDTKTGIIDYIQVDKLIPKRHQFVMPTISHDERVAIKLDESKYTWFGKLSDEGKEYFRGLKYNTSIASMERIFEKNHNYSAGRIHQFLYGNKANGGVKGIPYDISIKVCEHFGIPTKYVTKYPKQMFNLEKLNIPNFVDEEFAKFFGFMIGDGYMTKTKHSIGFATGMYEEDNTFYKNILQKYCGDVRFDPDKRSPHKQIGKYTVNSFYFAHLMQDMGFTHSVYTKKIPDWIFKCSNSIKEEFIDGLMDADGHRRFHINGITERMSIELCNKQILEGLKELCHQLGWNVSPTITSREKTGKNRIMKNGYRMKDVVSYGLNITKVKTGLYENILSVEPTDEYSDVYDIRVDNELHNFIADGCVVHNSPARRAFYIDPGNVPPKKAQEYLQHVMNTYKQKKVYDESTGTLYARTKHPSMLEDFFLLRYGDKGTQIDTLDSQGSISEIDDLLFFHKKAMRSLRVPFSRTSFEDRASPAFQNTAADVTKEELKFSKFIWKLRNKFNELFFETMYRQLCFKNIIKQEEWESIRRKLVFRYDNDMAFAEEKRLQNYATKLEILGNMKDYVGTYFSKKMVYTEILGMTDQQILEIQTRITEEEHLNPPAESTDEGQA
jgi:hypothetical protein